MGIQHVLTHILEFVTNGKRENAKIKRNAISSMETSQCKDLRLLLRQITKLKRNRHWRHTERQDRKRRHRLVRNRNQVLPSRVVRVEEKLRNHKRRVQRKVHQSLSHSTLVRGELLPKGLFFTLYFIRFSYSRALPDAKSPGFITFFRQCAPLWDCML